MKVISGLISPLNEPVDYQGIVDVNEEGQPLVLAGTLNLDILKYRPKIQDVAHQILNGINSINLQLPCNVFVAFEGWTVFDACVVYSPPVLGQEISM